MTTELTTTQSATAVGVFDQARAEAAVRELLYAVGEDPDRQGLVDTPARVARAYREVFAGLYENPDDVLNTTFEDNQLFYGTAVGSGDLNVEGYTENLGITVDAHTDRGTSISFPLGASTSAVKGLSSGNAGSGA